MNAVGQSYWHEWLCQWCRKCGYAETDSLAADILFAHMKECDKNPIKLNDFEEESNYWGE